MYKIFTFLFVVLSIRGIQAIDASYLSIKTQEQAENLLKSFTRQKNNFLSLESKNLNLAQRRKVENLILLSLIFSRDYTAPRNKLYMTMTIRPFISEIERLLYNNYNFDDLTYAHVHQMNVCYYIMNAAQIYRLMQNPQWRKANRVEKITNASLAEKVYISSVMHTTGRDRTVHRLLRSADKNHIIHFFQRINLIGLIDKIDKFYERHPSSYKWKNKKTNDPRVLEAKSFPQVFRLKILEGQRNNKIYFQTATATYASLGGQKILLTTGHVDYKKGFIEKNGKKLEVNLINFGDLITQQVMKRKGVQINFDLAKKFALDYLSADFSLAVIKKEDEGFFGSIKPFAVETDPRIYACIYDEDIEFVGIGQYSNLFDDNKMEPSDEKPRYYSSRVTFARPLKASNDPLKGRLSYRFSSFERLRSVFAPRNDLDEDVTGFEGLCGKGCSGASGMIYKADKGYTIVSILGQATDKVKKDGKVYNIHYPLLPYIDVMKEIIQLAKEGQSFDDYNALNLKSFTKMFDLFQFPEDSFEALLKQDLESKIDKLPPQTKGASERAYKKLLNETYLKNSLSHLIKFNQIFHKKIKRVS